jgi:hypothetical protein
MAAVHNWGNEDLLPEVKVNMNAVTRMSQLAQGGVRSTHGMGLTGICPERSDKAACGVGLKPGRIYQDPSKSKPAIWLWVQEVNPSG